MTVCNYTIAWLEPLEDGSIQNRALGWLYLETLNRQHNIESKPLTAESEEGLLWKHRNRESSEQRLLDILEFNTGHPTLQFWPKLVQLWMFSCKGDSVDGGMFSMHPFKNNKDSVCDDSSLWFSNYRISMSLVSFLEDQDALFNEICLELKSLFSAPGQ